MENHNFWWENQLFLWPFSIAMFVYQRVMIQGTPSWRNIQMAHFMVDTSISTRRHRRLHGISCGQCAKKAWNEIRFEFSQDEKPMRRQTANPGSGVCISIFIYIYIYIYNIFYIYLYIYIYIYISIYIYIYILYVCKYVYSYFIIFLYLWHGHVPNSDASGSTSSWTTRLDGWNLRSWAWLSAMRICWLIPSPLEDLDIFLGKLCHLIHLEVTTVTTWATNLKAWTVSYGKWSLT